MKFCFKIIVQVFAFYRVISIKVNFIFGRKLPDLGDPTKFFSIANLIYPLFAEIPYTILFFIKCVIFSLSYKQLGSGYLSYIYLYVISFNMYLWLLEDKTNENWKKHRFFSLLHTVWSALTIQNKTYVGTCMHLIFILCNLPVWD